MVDDWREQNLPDIAGLVYIDCESTHKIQTGTTPGKIQALERKSGHKVLPEPRWYLQLIHDGKRENSFLQRSVTGHIKHAPGQVPNPWIAGYHDMDSMIYYGLKKNRVSFGW